MKNVAFPCQYLTTTYQLLLSTYFLLVGERFLTDNYVAKHLPGGYLLVIYKDQFWMKGCNVMSGVIPPKTEYSTDWRVYVKVWYYYYRCYKFLRRLAHSAKAVFQEALRLSTCLQYLNKENA